MFIKKISCKNIRTIERNKHETERNGYQRIEEA